MPLIDPAIEFFFIRHGETDWNRDGRLQGQHDVPLNPLGRDQAAAAGRSLKHLLRARGIADPATLDFVASPLSRTRDTMERARAAMNLDPLAYRLDDRLKELSFGDWEGSKWPELKLRSPDLVKARKADKWGFVPPDGESYAGLGDRLKPWLGTVKHRDIVVAHGGVARVLMHLLAGISTADAPDRDIWQGRVMIFSGGRYAWGLSPDHAMFTASSGPGVHESIHHALVLLECLAIQTGRWSAGMRLNDCGRTRPVQVE